jgi:ectoine hydroxylase-related dioxygenase (phytanoyl-CoA dioxygenase family)
MATMIDNPPPPAIVTLAGELLERGYCIVRDAVPRSLIAALDADLAPYFERTPFGEGAFYGTTTKRFGRLLLRSKHAETLVRHPLVLGAVEQVLAPWCDCIQLNTTQAIGIHPGAPAQLPHRDDNMWQVERGAAEYLVNVIWPLTPFTSDNGATRVWPCSHGKAAFEAEPRHEPFAAELEPGSALVFLGSTLHGAGANRSREVRRAVVIGYSLAWLKSYENQYLAYPPEVARTFPPELAALVGYRQHRPNLGNFEGQCPSVLFTQEPDAPLGAVDALRPDQQDFVAAWLREQEAGDL